MRTALTARSPVDIPQTGEDVAIARTNGMETRVITLSKNQCIGPGPIGGDLTAAVLDGIGNLLVDSETHLVRAGQVLVVPADAVYGVSPRSERMTLLHVTLTGTSTPAPRQAVREDAQPSRQLRATESARQRHRRLAPHIDYLGRVATQVGSLDDHALRSLLLAALNCTDDELLPHLVTSESALYPAVEPVLRAIGGATRTMSIDHRLITSLRHELRDYAVGEFNDRAREGIRQRLYALQAVLRSHTTKEDELFLPLLDLLAQDEADALQARFEEAERPAAAAPVYQDETDPTTHRRTQPLFVAWQLCEEA